MISIAYRTSRKKIEGTKKAFEKDKAFIQRKSNSKENETNEENNVSNTERNDNNINEKRRDIPHRKRHNSIRSRSYRYNSKNYYHKYYSPCQRRHLRLLISHLIFQTFSCLHYAITQSLCEPGLEAYIIIKMTYVILQKIQMKEIFNDNEYEDGSIVRNKSTRNKK